VSMEMLESQEKMACLELQESLVKQDLKEEL
jgi:hypothetical protein